MGRKKSPESLPEHADGPYQASFRAELARLREAHPRGTRMSQAELDEAIGRKGKTYIGQLEAGTAAPPDRKTCEDIARALQADAGQLWPLAASAAIERLDRISYGGDLMPWLEARLAEGRTERGWSGPLLAEVRFLGVRLWAQFHGIDLWSKERAEAPEGSLDHEGPEIEEAANKVKVQLISLIRSVFHGRHGSSIGDFLAVIEAMGLLAPHLRPLLWESFRRTAVDALLMSGSPIPETARARLHDPDRHLGDMLRDVWVIGPSVVRIDGSSATHEPGKAIRMAQEALWNPDAGSGDDAPEPTDDGMPD